MLYLPTPPRNPLSSFSLPYSQIPSIPSPQVLLTLSSPLASALFSFSTSKRCFHRCSVLPLPPVFCLILSSLLFSHLAPRPPLHPSPWPTAAAKKTKFSAEKVELIGRAITELDVHTTEGSAVFCFSSRKTKNVARGEKLSPMLLQSGEEQTEDTYKCIFFSIQSLGL